jgi:hypothetical protein
VETAEQPFVRWAEVLDELRQCSPPLFGMLADTTALLKDGALVICIENPLLAQLLKEGSNKQHLTEAIRRVTGQTYPMALRRAKQVKKEDANDPLAQLFAAGRTAGVGIQEKE